MKKATLLNVIAPILFIVIAGCATMETGYHKYIMKGQILDVRAGEVYLCIGSSGGAKPGQEFPVYRYVSVPPIGKAAPNFKREKVGSVKITQVVDEHF